ncbi:hybrid sensor histidine kinase/response regulator transcription factor [Algibacter pacificus]|uniref:hybrid sensor histidine kinase/response regulator transcription factor n=1 Tax=Algibacter pacificus TaxID=2599389 RepID=UPI0011CB3535|nr:hybrid sensor histidine kinase/response regulator transcription factor [Algibacter pacificus]
MIKNLNNYCLISVIFLLSSSNLFSQWRLNHIGGEQGLSHNRVTSIVQDKLGYLWFGTFNGVNQYDGYTMKQYNYGLHSKGLSSNIVFDLFEDKQGFIWVPTPSGLNRINTSSGSVATYFKGDNREKSSGLNNIQQFQSGVFFINTSKGIKLFEINEKGELKYDVFIKKDKNLNIKKLSPSLNGKFWFTSSSGKARLYQLGVVSKEGQIPKLKIEATNYNGRVFGPGIKVLDIIEYPKNTVWVINSRLQLFKIKLDDNLKVLKSEKITLSSNISPEVLNIQRRIDMVVDDKNRLWIGGNRLLLSYNIESGQVVNLSRDTQLKTSIGDKDIQSMFIDRSNVFWICTSNHGLYKMDLDNHTFYNSNEYLPYEDSSNLFKSPIMSICEVSQGEFWFGTQSGDIVSLKSEVLNNNSNTALTKGELQIINNGHRPTNTAEITRLMKGEDGTVWVGTTNGLSSIVYNDETLSHNIKMFSGIRDNSGSVINSRVFAIEEDRHGHIWFAPWGDGLIKMSFDSKKEAYHTVNYNTFNVAPSNISNNNIRDILEDNQGNIWIGTNNGLNRLKYSEIEKENFEKFFSSATDSNTLSNDHILDLYQAKNGVLYIGTSGGGLNLLSNVNSDTVVFKHYTVKNGLPSNVIYQVREDTEGNIWLMHARKISKLNPRTGDIIYFEKRDGFNVDEFRDSAMAFTSSGMMFCGGVNGFTFFYPNNVRVNTREPQVTITNFKLFNELVGVGQEIKGKVILEKDINKVQEIKLPYHLNSFEFVFSSMHFSNPEKNKYKFILEGFDDKPQTVNGKERRFASYTNIPPGDYVFKVSGSNSAGIWNKTPKKIKIIITPPWYLTPFAILVFIITIAAVVYLVFRVRWNQIKLKNELKLESALHEKSAEINQMKLRFFTNISHELRTPLTLIIGPLQQIMEGGNDDEYLKRLNSIMYKNSTRLLRLINQLLDFRKVESGVVNLIVEEGDLVEFVKEIYDAFQDIADERHIDFVFRAEHNSIPAWFDNDKLEKILYNLLSNAFKFTPPNRKIEISINKTQIDNKGFAVVKVLDQGVGIAQEELPSLFERFYQTKKENNTIQTGSGLGLAYTKRLVEIHKGRIKITSEVNQGTNCTVLIPISKAEYEDTAILETQPKQYHFDFVKNEIKDLKETSLVEVETSKPVIHNKETPTILIVEDNLDLQEYLTNYFKNYYHVLSAKNGKEGLDIALDENPDLIVTDLMMSKMGGIEMCKIIKHDIKTSHIPVIILTAKSGLENEKEGLETGADEFVLKPFNIEVLRLRVANILKTKRQWTEKFKTTPTSSTWKELSNKLDKEFLKKSLKIVKKNIDNTEYSVGQFALDIGMSRSALHKKIKSITGQSTTEFIRTIRIKRAANLIKSGKYSVTEVVFMVGFSDPKYFRTCFKKQFEQTPTEYIKSYKRQEC